MVMLFAMLCHFFQRPAKSHLKEYFFQQVPSIARFNEAVLSLSAPPPPSHPSAPPPASSQTPSPPAPPSPAQPQPSQLLESRPNVQRITSPSNFSFTTSFLPASSSNTTVSVTFGFEEITESVTLNRYTY